MTMSNKKREALVRSSAAEYPTFVAATGNSEDSIEMRYEDENIWLTQKMMATLYDVSLSTINKCTGTTYLRNAGKGGTGGGKCGKGPILGGFAAGWPRNRGGMSQLFWEKRRRLRSALFLRPERPQEAPQAVRRATMPKHTKAPRNGAGRPFLGACGIK